MPGQAWSIALARPLLDLRKFGGEQPIAALNPPSAIAVLPVFPAAPLLLNVIETAVTIPRLAQTQAKKSRPQGPARKF
jgi:hypothetical protein